MKGEQRGGAANTQTQSCQIQDIIRVKWVVRFGFSQSKCSGVE